MLDCTPHGSDSYTARCMWHFSAGIGFVIARLAPISFVQTFRSAILFSKNRTLLI